MAICNPVPKPARLAPNWDQPYGVAEAIEGFKVRRRAISPADATARRCDAQLGCTDLEQM